MVYGIRARDTTDRKSMDTWLSLVPNKYRIHKTNTKHRPTASRNNLPVDARVLLKQRE